MLGWLFANQAIHNPVGNSRDLLLYRKYFGICIGAMIKTSVLNISLQTTIQKCEHTSTESNLIPVQSEHLHKFSSHHSSFSS